MSVPIRIAKHWRALCWMTLLTVVAGCDAAEAERPPERQPNAAGDASAADSSNVGAVGAIRPADSARPADSGSRAGSGSRAANATGVSSEFDRNSELKALAVGTWHDEYQGERTMVLRDDGTGSMVVELSGLKAALFASRLEFDMVWSVEDGRLNKRTVGGRPERRVKMILKMMGDRVSEPILELTTERMLLLDADGETKYDWRAGN